MARNKEIPTRDLVLALDRVDHGDEVELNHLRAAREQVGNNVMDAITTGVLTTIEEVAVKMNVSSSRLRRGVPTEAMVNEPAHESLPTLGSRDKWVSLPMFMRLISASETVRNMTGAMLRLQGVSMAEADIFMSAIATGSMIARPGDTDHSLKMRLQRWAGAAPLSMDDKLRQLQTLGVPEVFYALSRIPTVRKLLELNVSMARQWQILYELGYRMEISDREVDIVINELGEKQQELTTRLINLGASRDEAKQKFELDSYIRQELAKKLLVTDITGESGADVGKLAANFTAVSQTCSESQRRLMQVELEMTKVLLQMIESGTGVAQGRRSQADLSREMIVNSMLMHLLYEGVLESMQGVARLVSAAASAMTEARLYAANSREYNPNDPNSVLMRALSELTDRINQYATLITDRTDNLIEGKGK